MVYIIFINSIYNLDIFWNKLSALHHLADTMLSLYVRIVYYYYYYYYKYWLLNSIKLN